MSAVAEARNVVLVGFMGAGKSTVARELERLAGLRLIDLDELVVHRQQRSIPDIFREEGEAVFRDSESEALRSLASVRGAVIATGGGVVGREDNWEMMRALGTVVYLRAAWPTIRRRLAGTEGRPLADAAAQAQVEALWRRRLPLYERADLVVDTDELSAAEVARAILQRLQKANEG